MLKSASSNEFDLVASKVAMDSNNVVDQLMAFPSSENLNSFGAFNEGLEEGMEDLNAVAQENTGRESTGKHLPTHTSLSVPRTFPKRSKLKYNQHQANVYLLPRC